MSCLKIQNFKKIFLPKENTQNVSLTGENIPKELLDEISTGNVEKNCSDTSDRQKYSKIYNKIQTKRQ